MLVKASTNLIFIAFLFASNQKECDTLTDLVESRSEGGTLERLHISIRIGHSL
jgi:hypothetical protein